MGATVERATEPGPPGARSRVPSRLESQPVTSRSGNNRHRSGRHARPRITVSVPAELHAQVLAAAEDEAISVSEWVCEAMRAYLLLAKRDRLTDADWRRIVSG